MATEFTSLCKLVKCKYFFKDMLVPLLGLETQKPNVCQLEWMLVTFSTFLKPVT